YAIYSDRSRHWPTRATSDGLPNRRLRAAQRVGVFRRVANPKPFLLSNVIANTKSSTRKGLGCHAPRPNFLKKYLTRLLTLSLPRYWVTSRRFKIKNKFHESSP